MRTILTLSLCCSPLLAQLPNVGPPQFLPGDLGIGPAVADQRGPAMATGAGVTLLVYDDLRGGDRDVFATRLDAAGQPIGLPIPIATGAADQMLPQVAWNGSDFLVVWLSQEPTSGYWRLEPRARRVSPQGALLGAAPILLPSEADMVRVASDGQGWLVLTAGTSAGNSGIVGWRIDANGTLLDAAGVAMVPATYFVYFDIGVAWAGGSWLVIWSQSGSTTGDDVVGRRFGTALQAIDPQPVALVAGPRNEVQPHLCSNGSQFLITTWDRDTYWSQGVGCTRITPSLQVLDGSPIQLGASGYLPSPTAAWDGSQWVVGWVAHPSVAVARLTAAGTVLDPGGRLVEPSATASIYEPAVAAGPGGGAVVVWQDLRNQSQADLYGSTLTAGGALGTVAAVGLQTRDQQAPSIAAGSDGHVVVCRSADSAAALIVAQRFDVFGSALDAQPIVVGSGAIDSLTAVAFDGTHWLVCWNRGTQLLCRRLRQDGTFADAGPIVALNGLALGRGIDVAANGGLFLVTCSRPGSYPQFVYPSAVRVRGSDGAVLDPNGLLVGSSFAVGTRVAAHGTGFLVVYEQHWSHDQTSATIARTMVATDGTVGPTAGVAIATCIAWGACDAASDGTTAWVVWANGSNWVNENVHGQRLAADGSLLGAAVNLTGSVASGQSRPRIAYDGQQFVLAFESLQNNLFFELAPDIVGMRLLANGSIVDAVPFPLFVGAGGDRSLAIGEAAAGQLLIAAQRFLPDGMFVSNRVATRLWGPAGLSRYGTGTAGCAGPLRLQGTTPSRVGNAAFGLLAGGLPANGLALLVLGSDADVTGSDPFGLGVLLHVQTAGMALAGYTAGPDGRVLLPLPLPALPSLVGSDWFVQAAGFFGPCAPSASGLATSHGVGFVVLP